MEWLWAWLRRMVPEKGRCSNCGVRVDPGETICALCNDVYQW